jgi:hypothetical protein
MSLGANLLLALFRGNTCRGHGSESLRLRVSSFSFPGSNSGERKTCQSVTKTML